MRGETRLTPNFNLYPPGGYTYVDPLSGFEVSGGNWPELFVKLRAQREANGQPVGDPEAEVFAAFCRNHPNYCVSGRQVKAFAKLSVSLAGFASSMQAWIAETFTKVNSRKLGYVSREEYNRRAKICQGCPRQRQWSIGCAGCERNLKAVIKQTLGGKAPSESLAGCSLLREDTRVSCHLTLPPLDAPVAGLPARCWRRKE